MTLTFSHCRYSPCNTIHCWLTHKINNVVQQEHCLFSLRGNDHYNCDIQSDSDKRWGPPNFDELRTNENPLSRGIVRRTTKCSSAIGGREKWNGPFLPLSTQRLIGIFTWTLTAEQSSGTPDYHKWYLNPRTLSIIDNDYIYHWSIIHPGKLVHIVFNLKCRLCLVTAPHDSLMTVCFNFPREIGRKFYRWGYSRHSTKGYYRPVSYTHLTLPTKRIV